MSVQYQDPHHQVVHSLALQVAQVKNPNLHGASPLLPQLKLIMEELVLHGASVLEQEQNRHQLVVQVPVLEVVQGGNPPLHPVVHRMLVMELEEGLGYIELWCWSRSRTDSSQWSRSWL